MGTFGTAFQPFLAWLLETTLVASVVICLILVLQKLLGHRLGPRWSHALWLVLLLRMVLPWTPPSPISLFSLIPTSLQPGAVRETMDGIPRADAPRAIDSAGPTETTTGTTPAPGETPDGLARPQPQEIARTAPPRAPLLATIRRMLPLLWLAGAILLGGYLAASNFALWRIIKREHPLVKQPILELFEQCKSQMGVETIVALVPSDQVRTAALFGFVRPRLLLPREMIDTASPEELRYIFLHELAHLKRHDIYLGWLVSLLQVLHWFNPLVWLAFHRMRTDRELACDALVLTRTGQDKSQEYGGAIVGLVRRFSRCRPLPAMAGIMESKSQLKRRIAMITQFKHNSYRWSPLAAVLIVILACISLPDAEHTKASETSAAEHTDKPNLRKIRIPTKPQNGVLSPDGNKLAFMSDDAVWVVPLHGKVDPDIAGEPVRLTEVPGIWDASNMMAWSADGKWIAVYGQSDEVDGVYVLPVAGGKPRVVQLPEQGGHLWSYRLSLSPDGQILAFSALEPGKRREEVSESHDRCIYTIPTAGGKPTRVSSGWARLPSFSPDGRFIAYVGYRERDDWQKNTRLSRIHGDLWVVRSAGGTPVKLATVEGRLRGPVWSPDGKYIAAHYEPGGTNDSKEIWVFPLSPDASSAGEPEKIALPRSSMNMLAGWTPEGQLGVFLESEEHWAGYTVPSLGGQAVQVTPESIVPYYPRWSPNGERIYFRGVYKDEKNVKIETLYVPAAGGDTVDVAVQSEHRLVVRVPGGGFNVSPDGKKIVFSAFQMPYDPKEGADIWTISLDGGLATRLTNDGSSEGYPCWSPDGQQIAFVDSHRKSDGESFNAIYVIPAEGGEIRQVSSESDNIRDGAIAFSPDVERIAFFSSDGAIRTIPVGGGQAEMLVTEVKADRHSQLSYSPDGSKIAYNAGGKIWITSLGGGKPEELRTGLPKNAKLREFGWSPDGEKIAFIASSGGEKEFWLIEDFLPESVVRSESVLPPTFRKIKIASKPQNGVLSRDGNKLAFVSDGAVWVVPLRGKVDPDIAGEPVRLAEVPGIWDLGSLMAWSANGEWIAVNTWPDAEDVFVHVIPAAGGEPRVVQMPKRGGHSWSYRLSLSPDGQMLAFSALELRKPRQKTSDAHDRYICTMPTAGGEPKQVSSGWGRMPSFSPDGETIAYVDGLWREEKELTPLGGELWIVPSKGGTPIRLATVEGRLRGPVWSPDGRYIAAHHEPGGSNDSKEIWVFPLSPDASSVGEPEKIALPHSSWNMLAGWTPEGKLGVFLTPNAHWACYTVPAAGGKAVQITPESALPCYPRWSPDGERIYFRGDNDDNALVSYVPAAGGQVGKVPLQMEQFNSTVPGGGHNISPDGKRIVMSAEHDIWTIALDDGMPTRLTNDDSHETYPCWSPDGEWVAFIDEVNYAIYVVPAAGGEIRQVSSESDRKGSGAITFSPDGKRIAFFSDGSIKTIPVEGGEPTVLVSNVKSSYQSQLVYSPDGSKIAHSALGKIWITRLDGSEPEELLTGLPAGAKLVDVDWSPAGEKIAFLGIIGGQAEFCLIENFLPQEAGK